MTVSNYCAIYDFELFPYALGDVLTWNVRSAVHAEEAGCSGVDIYICLDPRYPSCIYQRELVVAGPEQRGIDVLGNHLLENGFGLACAGAAAEGVEADAWWRSGCAILSWQLPRQFLADGGHFERSASYHLALTAALRETIALADASGRKAKD